MHAKQRNEIHRTKFFSLRQRIIELSRLRKFNPDHKGGKKGAIKEKKRTQQEMD